MLSNREKCTMSILPNLSLAAKGRLLVAVPLILLSCFMLFLAWMDLDTERATEHERRARTAQSLLLNCEQHFVDASLAGFAFAQTHHQVFYERFRDSLSVMPAELKEMRRLLFDNAAALKEMESLSQRIEMTLSATREYEQARQTGDMGAYVNRREFWEHELISIVKKHMTVVRRVTAAMKLANPGAREQQFRANLRLSLLAGFVASIALSITVANVFSRHIANRISHIVANTLLVASEKELPPAMPGNDEIAALDRSFHEMYAQLEQSRSREKGIIRNAIDVICILDRRLRFVIASPSTLQIWGIKHDQLSATELPEIILPDDRALVLSCFQSCLKEGSAPCNLEARTRVNDGRIVWMRWTAQWNEAEELFFCIAHDISERKELEQLKADFVNMITHDLRTPLTGMTLILDMLEMENYGALNDQGLKAVAKAKLTTDSLLRLVNELLELEKVEAGQLPMSPAEEPVDCLIEVAVEMVTAYAQLRMVNLRQDAIPDCLVKADSTRIVQVLQNLLANAIKFSEPGMTVTISAQVLKDTVELSVSDQGPGIPAHLHQFIFDRFRQVEDAAGTHKQGSGLGLAFAKAIVQQHGGTIGVQSAVGQGSRFWLRLPLSDDSRPGHTHTDDHDRLPSAPDQDSA